jgi:hypothetical protein
MPTKYFDLPLPRNQTEEAPKATSKACLTTFTGIGSIIAMEN